MKWKRRLQCVGFAIAVSNLVGSALDLQRQGRFFAATTTIYTFEAVLMMCCTAYAAEIISFETATSIYMVSSSSSDERITGAENGRRRVIYLLMCASTHAVAMLLFLVAAIQTSNYIFVAGVEKMLNDILILKCLKFCLSANCPICNSPHGCDFHLWIESLASPKCYCQGHKQLSVCSWKQWKTF